MTAHDAASPQSAVPEPERIGPYLILDVLGEGGMGTVYLSEQIAPVQLRVALKVVKLGMDSKAVLARFDAERRALERLDHPCIARVYDAGMLPSGQPWIAMEFFDGVPIDEFCARETLPLAELIALFLQVCAGVQHAHHHGVLHRDLKPSNVLVQRIDGKPQAKIIDFGLAKALQEPLSDATLLTVPGQVLGTPEYMSPEQATRGGIDVDTRTDVWALGVMLYQLLTGELPFAREQVRGVSEQELRRVVCETDPDKPSTKVSASRTKAIAANRPNYWERRRALAGDLDWITLRALEKDRNRRYQSPGDLAADLARFLRHDPILARPPSLLYLASRFVHRHRILVAASAAVLLTALGGAAAAFVQYRAAQANAEFAAAKVREFRHVSGVVLHERALARERDLVPAWPDRIPAMEAWLAGDVAALMAQRSELIAAIESLRTLALPWSAAEQESDRRTHPKFADHQAATLRRAERLDEQAFRSGARPFVEAKLTREEKRMPLGDLAALAKDLTSPDPSERRAWQQLDRGVAVARAALAKAERTRLELRQLEALVIALLEAGQDQEARQLSTRAATLAQRTGQKPSWGDTDPIDRFQQDSAERLRAAEHLERDLALAIAQRRTWSFTADRTAESFLHDTLVQLLHDIDSLAVTQRAEVLRRLKWATELRDGKLSLAHPRAAQTWDQARVAIQQSPRYQGCAIELRDDDIQDLVPIGINPVTQLFECYHLPSAWDGASDPRSIAIPAHAPDGSIPVSDDAGIVFVLLPGGTTHIGAQATNSKDANYSSMASRGSNPVLEVTVAPFFLARHELSQGQWARLYGPIGDRQFPSMYHAGIGSDDTTFTLANPVENTTWSESDELLRKQGLVLPTAVQWEYAARAGTQTGYWCGDDPPTLLGNENVFDQSVLKIAPAMRDMHVAPYDDGHIRHTRVGTFRANPFGFYDMLGNVSEWCADAEGKEMITLQPGEKVASSKREARFAVGGSFSRPPDQCIPSERFSWTAQTQSPNIGLRAARALRP